MRANQIKRIERLEQSLKEHSWFSTDCICFPENQSPLYGFSLEYLLLKRLQCPLHGERSISDNPIYVSQWVREKIPRFVQRQSEQYRKAWFATFPPNLWPGVEEEAEDGSMYLILKDGSRLLAEGPPVWRTNKVQWLAKAEDPT